jgi:LuxR family transcriptional regulator, maltose regulon positive regulatory protein
VEKTISAKITPPSLSGVFQRTKIFTLLDRKMETPIIWVSSPAGSGKTKLVSSYLDSRKLPCIWYRCDEGDSDLATFFYYMGIAAKKAAPRYRNPLPLLTPEYAYSIPIFTRRYFEKLCSRLMAQRTSQKTRNGFFIILDDYQDVPADSAFHGMIANGLDAVPEGAHVMVISRNDPPAAFARLLANDKISVVEYRDVRFTFEESKGLLEGRMPNLDSESIKAMYGRTEGWAAGIVLMLMRASPNIGKTEPTEGMDYAAVFDYFAAEIFDKTEKEVQGFLLKTAFLPILSVSLAEKLAGVGHAGRILATLNRQNYFTERLSGAGERYKYHPLFRDFLLNRVKANFAPHELAVMQREAGQLLEQSEQIEHAARLYKDAGERQCLARMVIHHAREFLRQGRSKTVEEWIACIPGQMVDDNPWLLYWKGMCSFSFDMPQARRYLERAFLLFKTMNDVSGVYLAWAGIIDTYVFGLDEWSRIDDYLEIFDELRIAYSSYPSSEIDLIVSSRMLVSALRKTDQPEWVNTWHDRVSSLLEENPYVDIQMYTVFCMSLYYLWTGEYHKNGILLERAETEILHHRASPFFVIRIKLMKGNHYWHTAQYDAAFQTLSEGLEISGQSGVHAFDSLLWSFRAMGEMSSGRMEMAEKSLRNQRTSFLGTGRAVDIFFYHMNSAWHAILAGNASLAAENLETISATVAKMGMPYYGALWNIGMARVAFLQSRKRDAQAHINEAHRTARSMKSAVIEWYSLLISAYFLLEQGREKEGLLSLRRGLALGQRYGYCLMIFYQPSVMQFLCAKALEKGIEPEYVKGLIKKLGLTPPVDPAVSALALADWPFPLKIHDLGGFEIFKNDEPLAFSGKVQKKPLELLKAVIAFGGTHVSADSIADRLWPDAEGGLAYKSFLMTLMRLRQLLGGENFVTYSAGQLGLDPRYCRVDSIELGRLMTAFRPSSDEEARLCDKAMSLYKGPFLPSDTDLPWTAHRREMLKDGIVRAILAAGRFLERSGQWEKAVECYMKGIDKDELSEEFYQRLIVCYRELGNNAEAVRAYRRCRSLLRDELGISPSDQTEAIHASIVQNK